MMLLLLALFASAAAGGVRASTTPVDDYVRMPDATYKWDVNSTFRSPLGFTVYNIMLTSQTWLPANTTNIAVWRHFLQLCVPDKPRANVHTAFMYIDGGHNNNSAPMKLNAFAEFVCVDTGVVSAALQEIPNQPAYFYAERPTPQRRTEDAVIAYTWRHFFDMPSQPYWLLRCPMVKAAVRAMDAITAFSKQPSQAGKMEPIETYVVAGASKRGWTTWLTAGVDKRVVGAIPIVMPIANMQPNVMHHYRAYGGWSFAFKDYLAEGLMRELGGAKWAAMAAIVDPAVYFPRLTMPKLVICATGDEFFLPDSVKYFWDKLPGPKLLNVVPNAEHSLASALLDVASSSAAFVELVVNGSALPTYSYALTYSNGSDAAVRVTSPASSAYQPASATLWRATTLSTTRRDFRLVVCRELPACAQPVLWWEHRLSPTPTSAPAPQQQRLANDTVWSATVDRPREGWTGFLIELIYNIGASTLRVTTEVNVTPDIMPFAPCTPAECQANGTATV